MSYNGSTSNSACGVEAVFTYLKVKPATNSLLWKIIIGFVCVAIPLYAICLATIWVSTDIVTGKVQDTAQSRMNLYKSLLEKEIGSINQMLIALNNDPDLAEYALLPQGKFDYDNVHLQSSIATKMSIIYYSNDYIRDVFLVIPKRNQMISFRSGQSVPDEGKKAMMAGLKNTPKQLDHFSKDGILSYVIPFEDSSSVNGEVEYLLGVDINPDRIQDGLKMFEKNDVFNVFLMENANRELVRSGSLTELDKSIYESVAQEPDLAASRRISVDGEKYMTLTNFSADGVYRVVSYIRIKDMLAPILVIRNLLWLFMGISPIFFIVFSYFVYKHIHRPLRSLVKSMREVERGNLNVRFVRQQGDEFGYVYKQCNQMVGQLRTLIEEVLEKKIQLQQMQIRQLQSQINPHFLFNCFYIGYRMAKASNNENIARLCKYLGDYFRFITKQAQDEIALKDEMKFTVTYLEIQKIRFPDKLDFVIREEGRSAGEAVIPGLTIQPIVENAILHGIEQVDRPGLVEIDIRRGDGGMSVEIRDNGKGMTEEEQRSLRDILANPNPNAEHCGLWNVHWRLRNHYNSERGLTIGDNEGGGLKVSFLIPEGAS
ncbi:sensor histidine kinase [Cohnella herbarum]|uniref:Histidine kinase n=1 Tax=Cohnella herbarum TaxID=2728023 RepID=A0A7Z2VP33_9BACL|nr:histidine kinase [Cohnella herbarum]QJD86581.1 histidine kinase [Cohnella herbarum]